MTGLAEMVEWGGGGRVLLSLFVVMPAAAEPVWSMSVCGVTPAEVREYRLEPPVEDAAFAVFEVDARFCSVPDPLVGYVAGCLSMALANGALVAWFGFEGSFSFDHLLTADVASQVYGVGDGSGLGLVAHSDQLGSEDWIHRVAVARRYLPWS